MQDDNALLQKGCCATFLLKQEAALKSRRTQKRWDRKVRSGLPLGQLTRNRQGSTLRHGGKLERVGRVTMAVHKV